MSVATAAAALSSDTASPQLLLLCTRVWKRTTSARLISIFDIHIETHLKAPESQQWLQQRSTF
jgi:hypothetical protein